MNADTLTEHIIHNLIMEGLLPSPLDVGVEYGDRLEAEVKETINNYFKTFHVEQK